ncbi:hypothetical protein TorRG33x02_175340 [Trema orientale]|uniref:Uncharacterized protein n=1 Tax=Trema orientale TaxID=63057 RepID=A0A2P5EMI1_TREOI|nr:hypothetical protein TorRG33x02_175340 [Trema orientale]
MATDHYAYIGNRIPQRFQLHGEEEAGVIFSNQSSKSLLLLLFLYEHSKRLLLMELFCSSSLFFMPVDHAGTDASGNKYVDMIFLDYVEHLKLSYQILVLV